MEVEQSRHQLTGNRLNLEKGGRERDAVSTCKALQYFYTDQLCHHGFLISYSSYYVTRDNSHEAILMPRPRKKCPQEVSSYRFPTKKLSASEQGKLQPSSVLKCCLYVYVLPIIVNSKASQN